MLLLALVLAFAVTLALGADAVIVLLLADAIAVPVALADGLVTVTVATSDDEEALPVTDALGADKVTVTKPEVVNAVPVAETDGADTVMLGNDADALPLTATEPESLNGNSENDQKPSTFYPLPSPNKYCTITAITASAMIS